jgi:hypothetical protein
MKDSFTCLLVLNLQEECREEYCGARCVGLPPLEQAMETMLKVEKKKTVPKAMAKTKTAVAGGGGARKLARRRG